MIQRDGIYVFSTDFLPESLWNYSSIQDTLRLLYFRQQVHICVPLLYPGLLYRLRPSQILLTLIHINSYRTKPMHETIPFHSILQRPRTKLISLILCGKETP